MISDNEMAWTIIRKRGSYVGKHNALRENIAADIIEGISIGRREGLELAAKIIAQEISKHA